MKGGPVKFERPFGSLGWWQHRQAKALFGVITGDDYYGRLYSALLVRRARIRGLVSGPTRVAECLRITFCRKQ